MKGNPDGILYCCMSKRNPIQEERLSRQLLKEGYADFFRNAYNESFICRGKKGKPYDSRDAKMQFNISHCKSGAAAVVSGREVGVDMEVLRKVNACIVRKCCSKKEAAYVFLENDTNRNMDKILTESEAKRFLRLWTLKESFVKMTGDGLSVPFHEVCFDPEPLTGLTDGRICQISGPCSGAKHFLYTKKDFSVAVTVQCRPDENPDFIWKLYDKQEIENALETVTYLHTMQYPL